jgi:hypothetical protein
MTRIPSSPSTPRPLGATEISLDQAMSFGASPEEALGFLALCHFAAARGLHPSGFRRGGGAPHLRFSNGETAYELGPRAALLAKVGEAPDWERHRLTEGDTVGRKPI